MPEKSVLQVVKELIRIRQYKWEFLRRNKNYQNDYAQYIYDKEKKCYEIGENEFNKWQEEQASEFSLKWGIDYPCNPKKQNLEHLPDVSHDAPAVQRQMRHKFKTLNDDKIRYYPTWADIPVRVGGAEIRIPDLVVFGFNLNYPKGKILPLFEKELDKLIKQRKNLLKKYRIKPFYRQAQIKPPSPKKRNLYDEYLRIWDFIERNRNKRWAWKAKRLYPKGTVSEHMLVERYNACKELIDGGYIDIK